MSTIRTVRYCLAAAAIVVSVESAGAQTAPPPSPLPPVVSTPASNKPSADAPAVRAALPEVSTAASPRAPDVAIQSTSASARPADLRIPHELSPFSMFMAADVVVKTVMLGLVVASLVTWTIFVGKSVELALAKRRLGRALGRIRGTGTMVEARLALGSGKGLLPGLLAVTTDELEQSAQAFSDAGVKERSESRVLDLVRAETQNVRRGMGLLATIGSTAPFVGLFGTVWGIMNAFIGISKAQTTNLAVVAPGIAEALLATAIGLVAAIPAVIIYNHFSRATRAYQQLVNRAASAVARLLSREIDRRRLGVVNRAVK